MESPPVSPTHTDFTQVGSPPASPTSRFKILKPRRARSPSPPIDRQRQLGTRDRTGVPKLRHDLLCGLGEFVGTFLFLFMAFMGAQSAIYNKSVGESVPADRLDNETILYIALSFGMSLITVAWAFFRITGSAFNPAVTMALWLVGGCTGRRCIGVILCQMVGGIAAAGAAKGLTLGTFGVANRVTPGLSYGQGFGIEMFTTGLLVFTVLMLAAEKSRTTFLAPVGIGMALFIGHIASVGWTGAGINPARTFGPDVVTSFVGYTWFYYVGQMTGSLVATLIYVVLKNLDYQGVVGEIDVDRSAGEDVVLRAPLASALSLCPGIHMRHAVRHADGQETGRPQATAV